MTTWDRLTERQMALLVIGFGLLLYLPFAGSYGLWDPWETHYGEVARQMTRRGDFISLWWPGSSREGVVFQSKPVLSFWLMSLAMHLAGVGLPGGTPSEMALGRGAEWAVRTPFCLLGAVGLYGVYLVASRLGGRRAGVLSALVAATCPLYALVARQAMTDLSFVAPMTLALALAVLAVVDVDVEKPLSRRHPLFLGALALFALAVVPQLLVNSIDLRVRIPWQGRVVTAYGALAMLPYDLGFLAAVLLVARARRRAALYLFISGTLCGLSVLGKGLAGVALPLVIFAAFLLVTGHWRALGQRRLLPAVLLAMLACAVVAVPWHHAMIIRHGWAWWNELFGDNQWRRLMIGRHGDRGTFAYYLRELGYGTGPWLALVPAALAAAVAGATGGEGSGPLGGAQARRRALACLGALWAVGAYAVVSLSMTKFHHYVLPAVPGLAILVGCFLDDWLAGRRPRAGVVVALTGVPLLLVVGLDLVSAQSAAQRFLWLFSYDYIRNPHGRGWPQALDFRPALLAFGAAFVAALVVLAWRRARRPAALGLAVAAVLYTFFLLDDFIPRVAPFWSQKGTIAAYFHQRRSPDERLVAYKMFWRGETFYTSNAIFEGPGDERTVFDSDGDESDVALRAWIARHRGQRHFFLFEPGSRWRLEAILSSQAQATLTLIDQPNDKFALARADL